MPITMMVIKTFNFGNCKEVFQPATTYMSVIKISLAVLAVEHKSRCFSECGTITWVMYVAYLFKS